MSRTVLDGSHCIAFAGYSVLQAAKACRSVAQQIIQAEPASRVGLIQALGASTMHYGITAEGADFTEEMMSNWRVRLIGALLFFVPRANPDNERLYPQVRSWALELNEDGWPQREVGLDSTGAPLFRAPNDRNTGFWPDMAIKQFSTAELEPISEDAFNALWSAAQAGA